MRSSSGDGPVLEGLDPTGVFDLLEHFPGLTPARRRGMEILDDPDVDPAVRRQSIRDVTRSNRLLGGLRRRL